jgi:hypothetical protein
MLAEEVGMNRLPNHEESQSGKEKRQDDADNGLLEGGAMEGDPLLDSEVSVHFMMSLVKASGPMATNPVNGKSRFTMV